MTSDWETPCPAAPEDDPGHCSHWYDGEECHRCRDDGWRKFRRTNIAEMREWFEGMDVTAVSISAVDAENGSPTYGDMIARNPENHADQWLVAEAYFRANFEPVEENRQ